jgi:DNA-binding FrmR family transcriptional regulator
MLRADAQKRLTLRLRRIEGQVRGLERMVDEPRLCVELLTQIAAVQSALKGVGDEILHYHVRRCVPESFSRRLRTKERERLEEMEKIFVQYCKEPAHSESVPQAPSVLELSRKTRGHKESQSQEGKPSGVGLNHRNRASQKTTED